MPQASDRDQWEKRAGQRDVESLDRAKSWVLPSKAPSTTLGDGSRGKDEGTQTLGLTCLVK
jgi:hypothetical protein